MQRGSLVLAISSVVLSVAGTVPAATLNSFGSGANQFTMEFTTIGNPGNAADSTSGPTHNPAGSVPYAYNIGVYEVSRDMISKANAEGNLGITLDAMGFVAGGPRPNMPATGISWNEAARFVNWLNTSQGYSPAYKFSTQPGDGGYGSNQNISLWTAGDPGFDAANPFRNSLAHYFLPNADEAYKAAFYDANANAGAGGYWDYPTASDSAPTPVASGTAAGTAVYSQLVAQGPADVSLAGGLSAYGVMALGGNADEWEESEFDLVNNSVAADRGVYGGTWYDGSLEMSSLHRSQATPTVEFNFVGFRVASVPEPSSVALAVLGLVVLLGWRWRRGAIEANRWALSRPSCRCLALAILASACVVTSVARAAAVSIGFEGVVTGSQSDSPLLTPLGFFAGQPVSGYYAFDNATPGIGQDPITAAYYGAVIYAEVHVGAYFAHATNESIDIFNNFGSDVVDEYIVNTAYNRGLVGPNIGPNYLFQFLLYLADSTHSVFDSPALPAGLIDLTRFDIQRSSITFNGPPLNSSGPTGGETVKFDITRLFLQVPEPSGIVLLGVGAVGLFVAARRRRSAGRANAWRVR